MADKNAKLNTLTAFTACVENLQFRKSLRPIEMGYLSFEIPLLHGNVSRGPRAKIFLQQGAALRHCKNGGVPEWFWNFTDSPVVGPFGPVTAMLIRQV